MKLMHGYIHLNKILLLNMYMLLISIHMYMHTYIVFSVNGVVLTVLCTHTYINGEYSLSTYVYANTEAG